VREVYDFHGNGGGSGCFKLNGNGHFFDSPAVEGMIRDYQSSADPAKLGEIIGRCEPVVLSLIRQRATMRHEDIDELVSIVNGKLLRSLPRYSPERGTAFAFVSRLTVNMLCTTVTHRKKLAARYPPLERTLALNLPDNRREIDSTLAVDDLVASIRRIRSPATLSAEREAQRWYVESFIDAGFELRRHEAANAAMKVYGLAHKRSRELYDLTLLEIRRVLWAETTHGSISREKLKGTKSMPLLRYSNFLTPEEFTKFVLLMKDLAPYVVVLVKPENESRIKRGEWDAVRENLVRILDGIPGATPLFPGE
jgi:Sigma-70 region 2